MFSLDTVPAAKRNNSATKEQALCRFILHELHTTEQSYHRLLQMIYKVRYQALCIALVIHVSKPVAQQKSELYAANGSRITSQRSTDY